MGNGRCVSISVTCAPVDRNMEHVDPSARVKVHRHDGIPCVGRVGGQRREAHPLARGHRDIGPHPELDDCRRLEPASRQLVQLHGRVAAVVRAVRVRDRSRTGEPPTVREACRGGAATRPCAWRVDAVCGEMYMPEKSPTDSKPLLKTRGGDFAAPAGGRPACASVAMTNARGQARCPQHPALHRRNCSGVPARALVPGCRGSAAGFPSPAARRTARWKYGPEAGVRSRRPCSPDRLFRW